MLMITCIGSPRIFLKAGRIWEFSKTEDLNIKFLRFEDLNTVLFSQFLHKILKIRRQHILNLKVQNVLSCTGSPMHRVRIIKIFSCIVHYTCTVIQLLFLL